jgi:sugar phosphate isomerase/epimerase
VFIDFAAITRAVVDSGYRGSVEVEIFNADVWADRPESVVARVKSSFSAAVAPYLRLSA